MSQMWLFLVTEVLLFGGLFSAYGTVRSLDPEMFQQAHRMLQVSIGGMSTAVLLASSVTMALTVASTQKGKRDRAMLGLILTFLLACCFLVTRIVEIGELKNPMFSSFFSLYFLMTGLHVIHVVMGMGLMAWLMTRTANDEFGPNYYRPVELVGFYWHFVDLVWIYLFPLLYLVS